MLIISFLSLFISYFFLKKTKVSLAIFGFFIFLYFVISVFYIASNYFTWNWVDESVIYHLSVWLWWAWFWADLKIILIWAFILLIWIILPFLVYFYSKKDKKSWKNSILYRLIFSFFFLFSFILHPILKNFYELWYLSFSEDNLKEDFLTEQEKEKIYFIPEINKKGNTKNLVFIYLESFEKTYLDNNIFPNLTPNLNKIREESISFENVRQAYWTSWTIAWMVWSQCWIPLINSWWWWNSMHWIEDFLPRAFCMWDFLKKSNYNLSYIWWANIEFAWKWNFYKTHSFDAVSWRYELESVLKDKSYQNDWWLYDDTLFSVFYDKFDNLSKSSKNFWLFMINLDTHWDKWVLSNSCKNKIYDKNNKDSVLNSYHCVDYLVWELIEKLKSHKSYKDTVIVIASDHYAMRHNNSFDILEKNKSKRKQLFLVLNWWEKNLKIDKEWSTLDMWATILHSLWFDIEKFWSWVNLFKNIESFSDDFLRINRYIFEKFWSYPSLKKWITFDHKNKKIFIERKNIELPALILVDKDDTKQILWEDNAWELKLNTLIKNNSIYIDFCEDNNSFCLKIKNNSWEEILENISSNTKLDYNTIIEKLK